MDNKKLKWYQKPFITKENTINWRNAGVFFGIIAYIIIMIIFGINGTLSLKLFLIGIPICAIVGFIFSSMLKKNFDKQISKTRKK
jgi:ABC-type polysaccharide/polyol phosphate export permease